GLCLGLQIITGCFLSMHYCADVGLAFASVGHIMRDVNYGFLLRYFHANGASLFFLCLYLHIGRGLYYGSYTKASVWRVGVVIFLLTMATAFMGYLCPMWGPILCNESEGAILAGVHIVYLHVEGSNSPVGSKSPVDNVVFHVYYTSKD
ncbi:unnamed protein product, partial [Porites evermanni]